MKLLKYLMGLVLGLLGLVLVCYSYCYFTSNNTLTGTLKLPGLQGPVLIHRDGNGVPHIHAQSSDEDALFALGYMQAQDRFWQMEFQRRVVQGRLSEVLGQDALEKDKFLRTFGFYHAATAAWPSLSPRAKALIHSYTLGINAFLATAKLPLQIRLLGYKPQPWTDIDSIAWGKMIAFDLQNAWQKKITNYQLIKALGAAQWPLLAPAYPQSAPTTLSPVDILQSGLAAPTTTAAATMVTPLKLSTQLTALNQTMLVLREQLGMSDAPGKGSNDWVVAGKWTKTGKPLLADDPHLSLFAPNIWYLVELQGPHLHVMGASVPGLPAILIGHNEHIAWGVTNVNPDVQDLYVEPATEPLTVREEVIKVKGQADVHLPVRMSRHGPIISDISDAAKVGPRIALKWTALQDQDTTAQSLLEIDFANNWSEFTAALADFVVPSLNFVYADTAGNIGYYLSGRIPRREGWISHLPITDAKSHEWHGFIPHAELPHVLNPPEGIIVSGNNKPVADNYRYLLNFRWDMPPYRAERIIDMLHTQDKLGLTVKSFMEIQADVETYLWRDLRPLLLTTKPLDKESAAALEQLTHWDGRVERHSIAATIFNAWFKQLMKMPRLPFSPEWREPLFIVQQLHDNGPYCRRAGQANCAAFLSVSLQQAVKQLTQLDGHNMARWQWGRLHKAIFEDQIFKNVKALGWLWRREIASSGDNYTANVGTYGSDGFSQTKGAGYRQIVDLSNFDNSLYIIPLGESGNILSSHYDDLLKPWRDGDYLPMQMEPTPKTAELTLQPAA